VLADLRLKLIEVYCKFSLSGQGNGEELYKFLGHYQPYVLFFWVVMEEHDMLKTSMQTIDGESAAKSASDTLNVVASGKKK
jgi:hypothetical protein